MKIIDTHIRAQSMIGHRATVYTGAENTYTRHPFSGSGWTGFLMPGSLPSTEADIAKIFKQDSLADLYNKCVGVARGLVTTISSGNIVHMIPQANFYYKGSTFLKRQWGVNFRALTPDRIVEDADSKRSVTQLLAGNSLADCQFRAETFGSGSITVEFDTAVKLTHIVRNGLSMAFAVNAIDDSGVETSLGTWSTVSGDPTLYIASNPQTAKRFRIYAVPPMTIGPITLVSDSQPYTNAPLQVPGWIVIAHTNTRVAGDFEHSPLIPYFAETVGHGDDGNAKPFTLRTLVPDNDNILYCPKIRFSNRSI